MKPYRIATIPGDDIGKEVVPAGKRVLDALAKATSLVVEGTAAANVDCYRFNRHRPFSPGVDVDGRDRKRIGGTSSCVPRY
jgi:isocitrate/isopropylmalate dehydrogenase